MARASAVWIVRDINQKVVATFTVKHECAKWLWRSHITNKCDNVIKMPDGPPPTDKMPFEAKSVKKFLEEAGYD